MPPSIPTQIIHPTPRCPLPQFCCLPSGAESGPGSPPVSKRVVQGGAPVRWWVGGCVSLESLVRLHWGWWWWWWRWSDVRGADCRLVQGAYCQVVSGTNKRQEEMKCLVPICRAVAGIGNGIKSSTLYKAHCVSPTQNCVQWHGIEMTPSHRPNLSVLHRHGYSSSSLDILGQKNVLANKHTGLRLAKALKEENRTEHNACHIVTPGFNRWRKCFSRHRHGLHCMHYIDLNKQTHSLNRAHRVYATTYYMVVTGWQYELRLRTIIL